MGVCLSCCVADALCCTMSKLCSCCCSSSSSGTSIVRQSVVTRLMYSLGFVVTCVLGWLMSRYGYLLPAIGTLLCPASAAGSVNCGSYLAVYRVSLGFVLYHILLALLTVRVRSSHSIRAHFHNSWWLVKLLLWLGCMALGLFVVPSQWFDGYWVFVFVGSFVFILVQAMLLVDWAWRWAEWWVEEMESRDGSEGCNWFAMLLVTLTAGFYCASIAVTALMFVYYNPQSAACSINPVTVSVNLILIVLISIVSVLPAIQEANPRSGIFQAAILSFYITYLVASAITTQPTTADFSCSSVVSTAFSSTSPAAVGEEPALVRTLKLVGIVMTFLLLGQQAFSAGSHDSMVVPVPEDGDDEAEHTQYNYAWFHTVFAMAGLYMAAVLTNWATLTSSASGASLLGASSQNVLMVDYGFTAMWIRFITIWLCVVLYLWTLAAPVLLPDRDFGR